MFCTNAVPASELSLMNNSEPNPEIEGSFPAKKKLLFINAGFAQLMFLLGVIEYTVFNCANTFIDISVAADSNMDFIIR
jgi:hypothetical protein